MSMPPIKPGCRNFNITLKVPDGDVETVDKFIADHQAFMRETHKGPAEPFCLMYAVTKTAELKDSNDPSQGTTGSMLYAITETYQALEGCQAHMAAGQGYGKKEGEPHGVLFGTFLDLVGKYATSTVMMAEVVHTMADPLLGAMAEVKPGCHAFNISMKVPEGEAAAVDAFLSSHKTFMDETHPVSGDKEPMVLFYTTTKTAELKDSNDPSQGTTGSTLYAITEIYRGLDGCQAHMAAGQGYGKKEGEPYGALFSTFLDLVGKYATATVMMAPVVAAMHD